MKLSLIFIALCLVVVAEAYSKKQNKAWKDFKQQYNKQYSSKCEEKKRKKIFLQNKCKVDKINRDFKAGISSSSAAIYEWADLTDEEFIKTHTGLL